MEYLLVQIYLLFLIGVMISAGVIKEHHLFDDIFIAIFRKVKSKRLILFLISFFGGLLPIPGRVTISAGILDTIAPDDKESRSKFGIVDYLSTHTFYLWSPLEKTVVLPMAVLGISYWAFISAVWPLIAVTFIYIIYYIFFKIKEDDIQLVMIDQEFSFSRLIMGAGPLLLGIVLIAVGYNPAITFGIITIYYLVAVKEFNHRKILSYINLNLVLVLFLVLIASVFFKENFSDIENIINQNKSLFDINTISGFMTISGFAFIASWLMGSSGKYAGIVALLSLIHI